jgi:hypothetical protein
MVALEMKGGRDMKNLLLQLLRELAAAMIQAHAAQFAV